MRVLINRSQWGKRLHRSGLRWVSCRTWRACAAGGFLKLTKIPIQIVVGDNIPSSPQPIPQLETPRIRLIFKKQFVETVNHYGGDASLLRLPDAGIYGNTHAHF